MRKRSDGRPRTTDRTTPDAPAARSNLLHIQRLAGNRAATAMVERGASARLQRADDDYMGIAGLFGRAASAASQEDAVGLGSADVSGVSAMFGRADREAERKAKQDKRVAERTAKREARARVRDAPDKVGLRAAHAAKNKQAADAAHREEQERLDRRDQAQAGLHQGVTDAMAIRAQVAELDNWSTPQAQALWSATDRTSAEGAKTAFEYHAGERRSRLQKVGDRVKGANTWANYADLEAASRTVPDAKFTRLMAEWEGPAHRLEVMARTVTDSVAAKAPDPNDAADVNDLEQRLADRKTTASTPQEHLVGVLAPWKALRKKLLAPLYTSASKSEQREAKMAGLLDRAIDAELVDVKLTGVGQTVADAKGAKSQKDKGSSTAYALTGLEKVTVHVHWAHRGIGTNVAAGDNPAHWKAKSASKQTGVSTKIPNALAVKIHKTAVISDQQAKDIASWNGS